ncbi:MULTISPECIES: winged helix-turn-helix transcriptional regulator [Streptomyces]|uniref:DNA-binding HxlR family transcriptional regulator n=1 Tax=Streptomyces stelliscabiei TaxID=146820 RepID=A0A8I0NZB2_9ACTN|nr:MULTISPECIES: helix-turn-helix domain-containing protein [Streptomyces]MBE1593972.1 DNA-binding HxlR family transcriptional regulator [Streptomyces stelliscabiei]MDX2522556.1 helix-turn-helix domain-containing protein [Streptomyces stelliscabiei]MDX2556204.1 helix-turn-helix domain-containing protein [Streptomyces stelliscabiei]MDX2610407.1 helix-turn-helix domain-containing protein [Streptomyces stelliscabiei]MDX2639995.1 helix-turn-helix domain-containing protein [Streptomyces stelliscabi
MTSPHPHPPHQPNPPQLPEPLVALTRASSLLGRLGTGLIVTALAKGPADVAQLRERLPGLSDGLLTRRLRELTTLGLVTRTAHPGTPTSTVYTLASHGKALLIPLTALTIWAEGHLCANAPEAKPGRRRQPGHPAQIPGPGQRPTHAADRGHVREGREGEQTARPAPLGLRDSRRARASLRASRLGNR